MEASRCRTCGQEAFPPRLSCSGCRGESFESITLPEEGALVTWTVIHVAPRGFSGQTPYIVGVIELGGVRVTAQIVDTDARELAFGVPVRRVFRRLGAEGEGGILRYGYKFVLAGG
jgi:uncharacterized OB-fold protein